MLVLDAGIAGAAIAAVIAEAAGLVLGILIARSLTGGKIDIDRATLFDREKLKHMLAVNRDIMIRTASLIAALLFFTAQGARAGDVTLAANAVLNNFLLISAFFLDGLANAAEQLCGRAYGARDRTRLCRRGAARHRLGICLRARGHRRVRAVRTFADRHDDGERGGAAQRAQYPALRHPGAAAWRVRLRL